MFVVSTPTLGNSRGHAQSGRYKTHVNRVGQADPALPLWYITRAAHNLFNLPSNGTLEDVLATRLVHADSDCTQRYV